MSLIVSVGFSDAVSRFNKGGFKDIRKIGTFDNIVMGGLAVAENDSVVCVSNSVVYDGSNLNSVLESGIENMAKVDGVLSFIYHKKGTNDFYAVGDYLGRMPIYYFFQKRTLLNSARVLVASNLRCFYGLPLSEVHLLKQGHYLEFSNGTLTDKPYYELSREIVEVSEDEAVKKTHTLLTNVTQKIIDVFGGNACVFLSGGIDSSAVASIASKLNKEIEAFTFSVGSKGDGKEDLGYARLVAKYLGINLHEVIVSREEVFKHLDEIIALNEDFSWTQITSAVGQYFLARAAQEHGYSVAICGDLSDEIYASYPQIERWSWRDEQYVAARTRLMEKAPINPVRSVKVLGHFGMIYQDPFSDKDFVEFSSNVPAQFKDGRINGKRVNKYLLRKAFENDLPIEVVCRAKGCQGKVSNVDEFMEGHKGLIKARYNEMFNKGGLIQDVNICE